MVVITSCGAVMLMGGMATGECSWWVSEYPVSVRWGM